MSSHRFRTSRLPLACLFLTLALIALTARRVFTAALWGDELRTWRDGIETPLRLILAWRHNPDHAPLGHLMARAGADLFGVQHAWSLRIFSWIAGLACVPALAWLGRTLGTDGRRRWLVGVAIAAMFVVDPTQTFQLTQARMYSALLLSGTIALALAGSLLARPRRPGLRTIGLTAAVAVGLWTHSQMYALVNAALITAVGVTIARSIRRKRFDASALPILLAIAVGVALAFPSVLKLLGPHANLVDADETPAAPLSQLEDAAKRLSGAGWMTLLLIVSTIAGLASIARRRPALTALLALTIVCAFGDLLIAARFRVVGQGRYLTIAQPAIWTAVASICIAVHAHVPLRAVGAALIVGFLGLCGYQLNRSIELMKPYPIAGDFRDAMRYVAEHRRSDEPVIVLPAQPFAVYARYYGIHVDSDLKAEVARRAQPDKPSSTKHGKSSAATPTTTRPSTSPIANAWVVGILTRDHAPKSLADDPIGVAKLLAGPLANAQADASLRTAATFGHDELQRVVVVHVDEAGVHAIERPQGR